MIKTNPIIIPPLHLSHLKKIDSPSSEPVYTVAQQQLSRETSPNLSFSSSNLSARSITQEETSTSSSSEQNGNISSTSEKGSIPTLKTLEKKPSNEGIVILQQLNKPKEISIVIKNAVIKLQIHDMKISAEIIEKREENISTFSSITDFLGFTKDYENLKNKKTEKLNILTTSLAETFESVKKIHINNIDEETLSITIKLNNNEEILEIKKALVDFYRSDS